MLFFFFFMTAHFPKSNRLLKSKEFQFIQRQGKKVSGGAIQFLVYRCQYKKTVRMGLTVSSKYGPSVARNLFKRRNRDIYRRLLDSIPERWMIHIRPHGKVKHAKEVASYEALSNDWQILLPQLKSWTEEMETLLKEDKNDCGSRKSSSGAE